MCSVVENLKLLGREEGREEGYKESLIDAIQRMIRKNYSKEDILDLGYSEEEYKKAAEIVERTAEDEFYDGLGRKLTYEEKVELLEYILEKYPHIVTDERSDE